MDDGLGTMAGITRGSTRSDLESAYAAEVGETTLGTEFTAGGLSGLLDGNGPTAYITTLWAGTTCAFRYIRTHALSSREGRGNCQGPVASHPPMPGHARYEGRRAGKEVVIECRTL